MYLDDDGKRGVLAILKKLLMFGSGSLQRIFVPKFNKATENHQMHSLKALTRKNPNMGIHKSEDLSAEHAKIIGKELKKMRQDFFIEVSKNENGEKVYNLYCTNSNRSLLDNLKKKTEAKASLISEKPKLADRLSSARQKANVLNKSTQHKQRVAEKHKGVSL